MVRNSGNFYRNTKDVLICDFNFSVRRREGISQSVVADVIKIFRGKTVKELEDLQKKIESKIHGGEEGIDIGYWESLLSQLKGK